MPRSERKTIALVSAILLWLALNVPVAVPLFLDLKAPPIYLAGVLLFLEPLFFLWARYQYRYMLRAEPKPKPRDEIDA
ncbi:hypothetical protein AB1L88_26910 [Tautonia sp. JC769]|uniref:hypothetical protein n=1 Tax=Tautonia sp. JC769 TaxID=3232135 RepID=UPI00345A3385